jgi:3-oxoacyl-[acyl-carrier protein] reductase
VSARFQDAAVLVTGGSRGIGRGIALAFAREGADIVLNYATRREAAEEVVRAVEAVGRRCIPVGGSVADPELGRELVRVAEQHFGRVDVLVNNAGINRDGNLMMLRDAAWREVLDVNVSGTFFCSRAVIEPMRRQRRGVILNMTSTAGLKGRAGQVNYAATKGAVIALTKSLAQELGRDGIRVNALAPGFVETEMVGAILGQPAARRAFLDATPVGRFGTPEDIAAAALALADPEMSFVTGHILLINGGLFM